MSNNDLMKLFVKRKLQISDVKVIIKLYNKIDEFEFTFDYENNDNDIYLMDFNLKNRKTGKIIHCVPVD